MSPAGISIRVSDAGDAGCETTVSRIVELINEAYRWSEAEQWTHAKERTDSVEIRDLLDAGALFLAKQGETLAGVVKVEERSPGIGGFGMLATSSEILNQGIGGALVSAAENWMRKRKISEIEIEIVHAERPNAHKRRLHDWYTRLGYEREVTYPIAERIPAIAPLQRQVCVSTVYRKRIGAAD